MLREGVPGRPAVIPDSSADRAGIRETDVILELNHKLVDEKNGIEGLLEEIPLGSEVPVKILRDGKEIVLKVVLEEKV